MAGIGDRPIEKPTKVRWTIFSLACTTSLLLYLHRYTFALIKPTLEKEWGLDTQELGFLDSVFSTCYTLFQFPVGVLTDIIGVHAVLTTLIIVWTSGFALHAWVAAPEYLWYARALLGLGQSAVFANINRITRTWCPFAIRSRLQGIIGVTAGRVGGLSANLLYGTLLLGVLLLDWRVAVYILAALGFVHAIAFVLLFRNSPRSHPLVNDAEVAYIEGEPTATKPSTPPRMSVRDMIRGTSQRSLLNLVCLNVQTILSAFADNIYSNWIPLFLAAVHNLKFKEMGIYSALPLLGGAIGGLLGGVLNDWMILKTGNRRWSRSGVAAFGKGMAAVLIFTALLFYDSPYVFCAFLFFVKLFGDWSLTTTWGVVTDIGGRATASVFALNNSVGGIGPIVAPIVYGSLAYYFGWRTVFVFAGSAYVLCAASWLLINCTIPIIAESGDNEM